MRNYKKRLIYRRKIILVVHLCIYFYVLFRLFRNSFTAFPLLHGCYMLIGLWCVAYRSTAVSSAYDGRHTHCTAAVVRAADGCRTVTRSPQWR